MLLTQPRTTCAWKLGGTETLRASSAAFLDIFGGNLQNVSDELRRMIWADVGMKLVQVDQAGAEALIVAYLCVAGKFRDLFLHSVKPHVFVAMNLFLEQWKIRCKDLDIITLANTPIPQLKQSPGWNELNELIKASDTWKSQERYYYMAKQTCHSANYGIRWAAFRMNMLEKSKGKVVLTREQAELILQKYHALFPEIQRWNREVEQQLRMTGMVFNLQGFPFINTGGMPDDYNMKDWIAKVPQSTVGLITHKEITDEQKFISISRTGSVKNIKVSPELSEALERFGLTGAKWTLLNNCHDSSLTQCPPEEVKNCATVKKFFMEQSLVNFRGERFRMRSEATVGDNWGKRKELINKDGEKYIVNEQGMREITQ